MFAEWLPTILWGLTILLIVAWLFLNLRYRPTATKGIDSLADVEGHIGKRPLTLVQFFAPM
jgi:hypothetical protein